MKGSSKRPPPATARLRKFILKVLPVDSDFDGFCMDYFRSTFDKFAGGLDRTQKFTLLLQLEEEHEIVQALQQHEPARSERFRHLLDEGADVEGKRKRGAPSRLRKPSEVASAPTQPAKPAPGKTPSPVPQAMPNSRADAAQPMSSAALDKLRRELRKLLRDAPALTTALVSAGLGEAGLLGDKQVDSVCSALLGGRIADVTPTLAKLARDPEQGSAASQLLCLVLPLATDLESVLPPAAAAGRAPETLVLPLRTATFAEAAMARLDDRRAEFIPGRLYLQGLRRILMPAVAHAALIDPDGRELADALVRSLRTEHQLDGTPLPNAALWRTIQAEHPSEQAFRKGVRDQIEVDALLGESRYLLFIDDELDSEGHATGDAALDALWQTVRDKLPAVLPGLRVVRLTFRMTGQSPPAVADETKVALIIGKVLAPQ